MDQWQAYLYSLEQRVRSLEFRLFTTESELHALKESVAGIKPIHIDNIHYKVQELAVSDLSGTLNIGLTALADPKKLEEWVQQQTDTAETASNPVQLDNLYGDTKGTQGES